MASIIFDLIALILEGAFWIAWVALPTLFFFTAFALLFAATFGKVRVEFPERLTRIRWTGDLRIKRPVEGRVMLSPALGVMAGFIIWAMVVSAVIIFQAYQS